MSDRGEQFYEEMAADLDRLADVPTNVLKSAVSRHGLCQWIDAGQSAPGWSGSDRIDREAVAGICAQCPVAAECLEWELRTAGYATEGVWGLLDADERRRVFLAWVERRDGGSP